MRLPPDDRARLAHDLLASLDGEADEDAAAQWLTEIERRVAELDAGTARLEPWEDVRARIAARLRDGAPC